MSYLGNADPHRLDADRVRVLHVDDQSDVAELAAEFLERENDAFDVVTETTASDGLDRLENERIDCVVSDYDMPGTNGLEFLAAVRENHGDLPFVLYTGKGSEEIASEAISAGVTDYLQKKAGTGQYTVLANRVANAVRQYRSQRAVRETEEKLTQLAEATDDVLFMFDGDWDELLFVNSAYEDVWGGSIDELRDNPAAFREYIHPEDQAIADGVVESIAAGESSVVEYRVVPGGVPDPTGRDDAVDAIDDAVVRWIRGETQPVLDDEGSVVRIAGFVRDVTDRKTRERELEARAAAMDAAADGIAVLDANREYTFVNDAHARIYGFDDPDELLGKSWRACYDEAEIPRFEEAILPALAESGHWQGELTVTGADGRTQHQALALTSLAADRVVCVVRDVSDRVARERELERYEELVEAVTDSVSVVDADGTVHYKNPAIERILGYEPDELEGEDVFELLHPADREAVRERFRDLVAAEEAGSDRAVYRARCADGSYRWLESEASADEDSALDGIVVTSRDVTEREEYRERLERQNERLDEFATVVSHDLRNPLTVARTRLDLARDECTCEHLGAVQDHVDALETSLDRMASLVDDLRTFARAGEATLSLEPVDVAALAARCWDTVETGAAALETRAVPPILADEGLLQRLLENLFRNAVEHGATGPRSSTTRADSAERSSAGSRTQSDDGVEHSSTSPDSQVDAGPVERGGDQVTVTVGPLADRDGFYVADDGPGIPEDDRERVVEHGYSTADDGTGFGLSIVSGIADSHDWTVDVTESATAGARFEFTGVSFADGAA